MASTIWLQLTQPRKLKMEWREPRIRRGRWSAIHVLRALSKSSIYNSLSWSVSLPEDQITRGEYRTESNIVICPSRYGGDMGNSCSRIQDPCVIASVQLSKGKLPVCGNEHCGNILPLIDEESVDEYPGCQSTYLLDQTVNITSPNITGFETEGAINGSVLSFQAPNSLDMLSLIGLLSHKAASSPLVITDGNAMLHTSAETGRSQQADANPMKKPHAELQLYIVTWNMNGRVSLECNTENVFADINVSFSELHELCSSELELNFCYITILGNLSWGDLLYRTRTSI